MILTDPMVYKTKPSAYAKVAFNLFKGIRDKHQVAHTPMLYANKLGMFGHENLLVYPSGDKEFGEDVIERNCHHFNADAVLTMKDLYVFETLMHKPLEWIPYVPIDSTPVSPGIINRLKYAFKIISMSKFGYDELKKAGIDSTMIPHGVPEEYKQLEDKATGRRRFHINPEEFVIGFVGLNTVRKNIPRLLEVIRATIDMNPDVDVKGFLWTNIDKEVPLRPTMLDLSLNEYIRWPNPDMYKHGLPEEMMIAMYNSFDCTITVGNEGYWMPGLESLACGVPIIAPDYAAAADRVGRGCGYKVKVKDWTRNNPVGVRQPLVDVVDTAKKITKIINGDPAKYAKYAVRHASKYRWPRIIEKHWMPFLQECEKLLLPLVKNGEITRWDQEIG
jgi:glycosyltransferase involved in cell wall biosynthesis